MQPIEPIDELLHLPRQHLDPEDLPDPASLRIYDTTLRDGEQMPGVALCPEQKYAIARELSQLGVHIVDLCFPTVSPSEQRLLRMVREGRRRGELREDLELLVMCRASERDVDRTLEILHHAGFAPGEVSFLIFSSASSLHVKYKLGATLLRRLDRDPAKLRETPLEVFHQANREMVADAIRHARRRGVTRIEFGSEDASRTHLDRLIELVRAAVEAGACRYIFPDTTGSLTPTATRYYCKALTEAFPEIERVTHFHDDFDLGTVNTIEGIFHGFTTFSITLNGIGERAGNAPLHSVVAALKYLYGLEIPGFRYDRLYRLRRLIEEATGVPVPAKEPVIGRNVYSHESGIHTHGVGISRRMYEPLPHEEVGGESRFLYGKHSGTATLARLLDRRQDEIPVPIDDAFVRAVLSELKREREELIDPAVTAGFISSYYANLERLGFTEEEVVDLARRIADGPGVKAAAQ